MKLKNKTFLVLWTSLIVVSFQNCSNSNFKANGQAASPNKLDEDSTKASLTASSSAHTEAGLIVTSSSSTRSVANTNSSSAGESGQSGAASTPVGVSNNNGGNVALLCNRNGLTKQVQWWNFNGTKVCRAELPDLQEGKSETLRHSKSSNENYDGHMVVKCINGKYEFNQMLALSQMSSNPNNDVTSCGEGLSVQPILSAKFIYDGQCYSNNPDLPDTEASHSYSACAGDAKKIEVQVCSKVEIFLTDFNLLSRDVSSYKINGADYPLKAAGGVSVTSGHFDVVGTHIFNIEAKMKNGTVVNESLSIKVRNLLDRPSVIGEKVNFCDIYSQRINLN